MRIEVLAPGTLTSVQDTHGRPDHARFGVAEGGALDDLAPRLANRLLGNAPEAPLLEVTLRGPTLRFEAPTTVALVGAAMPLRLDGAPVPAGLPLAVAAGQVLAVGASRGGARAYLAIAGGLLVRSVLGSAATDLRAGFGGHEGRALRAGDVLQAPAPASPPTAMADDGVDLPLGLHAPLRVLPGPHRHRFAPDAMEALCAATWTLEARADRMGCRLAGPPLPRPDGVGADVASLGLPSGAIQVPGDGQPIVLLADHQPTGGYTVLACVIRADLRLLAQRLPGARVRFTPTTSEDAVAALRAERDLLARAGPRPA